MQTGIPVLKADGERDAGRVIQAASYHHVRGITQREDTVDGDAFAEIECFDNYRTGDAVGDLGGPTEMAVEAGVIKALAVYGLDAGSIEVDGILHGEGEPPGTVVAEGRDVIFTFQLECSGRSPPEFGFEPDDIARFPLRGPGGLDGTGGGEGGSGSVCWAWADGDAQGFPVE